MSTIDYKHHNPWIHHVRLFAEANKLSYGCALSNPKIKEGYVKGQWTPKIEPSKKKKRKSEEAEVEKHFSVKDIADMTRRQKERMAGAGGLTEAYLSKAEKKEKEKLLTKKFRTYTNKYRK